MSEKEFTKRSYEAHASHFRQYASDGSKSEIGVTWMREDSVDYWRHKRMRSAVIPLIDAFPGAKWLTVGDGRFGTDAHFLKKKGLMAMASDISDELLAIGKKNGFIDDYSKENAEKLSFKDSEFDFCFCKEAYHHFPRPMVALYEMLRVSKIGVVLIEPNDQFAFESLKPLFFRRLKDAFKRPLGKHLPRHSFEEVGNYVYSISKREIEKLASGMCYRVVAFKGLNDYYETGVEHAHAEWDDLKYIKVRAKIRIKNILCAMGVNIPNVLVAIILKEEPPPSLIANLRKARFKIAHIEKNPYI